MKPILFAAALTLALGGCAMQNAGEAAPAVAAATSATALYGDYATDRKAILAMAGDFRVMFDFKEIAAFVPGRRQESDFLGAEGTQSRFDPTHQRRRPASL